MENMFKKISLLALALTISLSGCSGDTEGDAATTAGDTVIEEETTAPETIPETTAAPETEPPVSIEQSIAFTVGSELEGEYVYEDNGSAIWPDDGGRYCDGGSYIIYMFPISASAKSASLTFTIMNQYVIFAGSSLRDMSEVASSTSSAPAKELTIDLTAFIPEKDGFIYVHLGDAKPEDGFGGKLAGGKEVKYVASES